MAVCVPCGPYLSQPTMGRAIEVSLARVSDSKSRGQGGASSRHEETGGASHVSAQLCDALEDGYDIRTVQELLSGATNRSQTSGSDWSAAGRPCVVWTSSVSEHVGRTLAHRVERWFHALSAGSGRESPGESCSESVTQFTRPVDGRDSTSRGKSFSAPTFCTWSQGRIAAGRSLRARAGLAKSCTSFKSSFSQSPGCETRIE
jgi:hypothetical protein